MQYRFIIVMSTENQLEVIRISVTNEDIERGRYFGSTFFPPHTLLETEKEAIKIMNSFFEACDEAVEQTGGQIH